MNRLLQRFVADTGSPRSSAGDAGASAQASTPHSNPAGDDWASQRAGEAVSGPFQQQPPVPFSQGAAVLGFPHGNANGVQHLEEIPLSSRSTGGVYDTVDLFDDGKKPAAAASTVTTTPHQQQHDYHDQTHAHELHDQSHAQFGAVHGHHHQHGAYQAQDQHCYQGQSDQYQQQFGEYYHQYDQQQPYDQHQQYEQQQYGDQYQYQYSAEEYQYYSQQGHAGEAENIQACADHEYSQQQYDQAAPAEHNAGPVQATSSATFFQTQPQAEASMSLFDEASASVSSEQGGGPFASNAAAPASDFFQQHSAEHKATVNAAPLDQFIESSAQVEDLFAGVAQLKIASNDANTADASALFASAPGESAAHSVTFGSQSVEFQMQEPPTELFALAKPLSGVPRPISSRHVSQASVVSELSPADEQPTNVFATAKTFSGEPRPISSRNVSQASVLSDLNPAEDDPVVKARTTNSTLDDSIRLVDMYKQMAERLETEKNDLLKVLADQADQFYQLQDYVNSLERELGEYRSKEMEEQ